MKELKEQEKRQREIRELCEAEAPHKVVWLGLGMKDGEIKPL
jgi:hypothetical protein